MSNRHGRGNCQQHVNSGGVGVWRSARSLPLCEGGFGGEYTVRKVTEIFFLLFFSVTKCHVACVDLFTMLADYVCACSLCLQLAHYVYNLLTMSVARSLCL